jgi:hypothetical protein
MRSGAVSPGWRAICFSSNDLFFEQGGFDGPGAALAPVSGGHFLDHADLDFVGGLKEVGVLLHEDQEVLARFVVKDDAVRAEAVTEGVSEERCFPAGVEGPLERAPLAFDD